MMKRILSLLLCLVMLLPAAMQVHAQETPDYFKIKIQPGDDIFVENAIVSDGELYIPAPNFARYTHYCFYSDMNTFLIEGQEADKAFKKVVISPETKRLAVGSQLIELKDCFVVDGVIYLPFCQMLPILNSEILGVNQDTIVVAGNELSMADLLYDFDMSDYYFNINEEFFDNKKLLLWYTLPSYVFDSVVNWRYDRLDFVFDSGAYEDYQNIFQGYLTDDSLYPEQPANEEDMQTILKVVTGINKQTKKLYNVMQWAEKLEDYTGEAMADDWLVEFFQSSKQLEDYEESIADFAVAAHDDTYGLSPAEIVEIVNYAYTYFYHVDDNFSMLDAVYDFSSEYDFDDTQRRGAQAVHDLYGGREWYAVLKKTADKLFEEALKEAKNAKEFALHKLTAKVSGLAWELVIPGKTSDIGSLPLHANVAGTAMMKAGSLIGSFETQESTEDYRLSLLLMMLSSRKCYKIMADTAKSYGQNDAEYRAKIERLEAMIKGLYIAANNAHLDTYEHFDSYAEKNRKMLEDADIFKILEPIEPCEAEALDESVYLDFLSRHPEYLYYALLDVNQDGCMELLVSGSNGIPNFEIDLWVYRGEFTLAYDDIWASEAPMTYSAENRWLEVQVGGTGGGGYWFYYLDETLAVQETSYEYYDGVGYYNSQPATDEGRQSYLEALQEKHTPETSVEIEWIPVPTYDTFAAFFEEHPEYNYYAQVDINQDGYAELLTSETYDLSGDFYWDQFVDLWINRGDSYALAYSDIYVIVMPLTYNSGNRWLEHNIMGTFGGGMEFFSVREDMTLQLESFESYGDDRGELYNGEPIETPEDYAAHEQLKNAYSAQCEHSVEIMFQPVP